MTQAHNTNRTKGNLFFFTIKGNSLCKKTDNQILLTTTQKNSCQFVNQGKTCGNLNIFSVIDIFRCIRDTKIVNCVG